MLSSPMEILELNDGESATFTPTAHQLDDAIIKPAHAPQGKVIKVLRIHILQSDKATFPYYWDVTGAGAIAQLTPLLDSGAYKDRQMKITALGSGVKKRHLVEVL
jgi:hypothetical protein